MFASTGHAPAEEGATDPVPGDEAIDEFISDLNLVLGDLKLTRDDIEHVYSGYLPVTENGGTTLTKRAYIHDHAQHGGPKNLFSISGIKFTTAHKEAENNR